MKKLLLPLIILTLCFNLHAADEWDKSEVAGKKSVSDIDAYIGYNNTALDRLLANYQAMSLVYNSASQITVSAGEVVCSNSDGSVRKMRQNTTATTVTWADIDTGAESGSKTYYVWADCDADATTATFNISLSSTIAGLTGITSAKKVGSFYNNSSSNIDRTKVYTPAYAYQPTDSSGSPSITGIYDYSTSGTTPTNRTGGLKVAYGTRTVAGSSTATVTGLPFSSASTYSCVSSTNQKSSTLQLNMECYRDSGSQITISNNHSDSRNIAWIATGY